jgi:hypothetical protein
MNDLNKMNDFILFFSNDLITILTIRFTFLINLKKNLIINNF